MSRPARPEPRDPLAALVWRLPITARQRRLLRPLTRQTPLAGRLLVGVALAIDPLARLEAFVDAYHDTYFAVSQPAGHAPAARHGSPA